MSVCTQVFVHVFLHLAFGIVRFEIELNLFGLVLILSIRSVREALPVTLLDTKWVVRNLMIWVCLVCLEATVLC